MKLLQLATLSIALSLTVPSFAGAEATNTVTSADIFKDAGDTNRDGIIDANEKAAMQQKLDTLKAEALAKYDLDHDGVLNEKEKATMKKDRDAAIIAKYDKDGDGKLSEAEKTAAREEFKKAYEEATKK